MPAYDDERFFPPARVAQVTLRNATTNLEASNVAMLLDSGADATMVPEQIVERLGVDTSLGAQFEIIGVEGEARSKSGIPRTPVSRPPIPWGVPSNAQ